MKAVTIGETSVLLGAILLSWFLVQVDCSEWIILQWSVTLFAFGMFVLRKSFGRPG